MASVLDLNGCAATHLADYTSPTGRRAWTVYDRAGDPSEITPLDVLAPALLDAPVRGEVVIAMFSEGEGVHQHLLATMRALVEDPTARTARFEEQDLDSAESSWMLVRHVLQASDGVPGVKASKVTKILHRKLPELVPIFDSKVAGFYACRPQRPWDLWPKLQQDVRSNQAIVDDWRAPYVRPDGLPMSRLRALDIVVWEHTVTKCSS